MLTTVCRSNSSQLGAYPNWQQSHSLQGRLYESSLVAVEFNTTVLAEKNMLGETQTPGSLVTDFSGTEISQYCQDSSDLKAYTCEAVCRFSSHT